MIARFFIASAITLSLPSLSAAQPRVITPVSAELEALAHDLVVLGPAEFIYGAREPAIWLPTEAHAPLARFHAFLEKGTRLSGDGATAVRWFYAELQRPRGMEAYYFDRLLKTEGRSPRSLSTLVIAHPMFDELNWRSLEVLARAVNEWMGREVVSEEELRSTWSPGGVDFVYQDVARARAEYPRETAEFLSRACAMAPADSVVCLRLVICRTAFSVLCAWRISLTSASR